MRCVWDSRARPQSVLRTCLYWVMRPACRWSGLPVTRPTRVQRSAAECSSGRRAKLPTVPRVPTAGSCLNLIVVVVRLLKRVASLCGLRRANARPVR